MLNLGAMCPCGAKALGHVFKAPRLSYVGVEITIGACEEKDT